MRASNSTRPNSSSYILLEITTIIFISILFSIRGTGQGIIINEFMSDNESTIQDADGDYSDWIELYNSNEYAVNLENYGLSDNVEEIGKWNFPGIDLPANGYLLVFASGKDRADQNELHTNFKISSQGEVLLLSNSNGVVVDQTPSRILADDRVLMRIPDGSNQWFETSRPTPGNTNETVNPLLFSSVAGFYSSPISQKITSVLGDSVYYTFDGSIPTVSSLFYPDSLFLDFTYSKPNYFSEIPTSPVQALISYKAWELPTEVIDKANIVRCASFRNGIRTSKVYTQTFFVDEAIFGKYTMPVISIVTDSTNLFGFEGGIFVPGKMQDPEKPGVTGNYFMKGKEWERPVHIEYFDSHGNLGFSQEAGIRIHGGLTRHAAQKTLRIYARDEYGESRFNFQLLPQKSVNSYERFLLRSTMGTVNSQTIIKDVLAHELVRDLNVEFQDYRPVIVYINGEYWGIHTLRDRVDEKYIEYTYGIDEDSIDMINANISLVDAGSNEHYKKLAEYIDQNDLSIESNYEYVTTQIDIHSFIDYVIAEMFFSNWDWPGNNQKLWRPQTPDGKWRWIFVDLDAAYISTIANMFDHAIKNEGEYTWNKEPVSSLLLRNLLKNAHFRTLFINRFAEILNEDFSPNKISSKLKDIKNLYSPEIPQHVIRWNYPGSTAIWENDIEHNIIDFFRNRHCDVSRQVMDYFELEEFGYNCQVEIGPLENIIVAPNPNDGNFFMYNNSGKAVWGEVIITEATGKSVYFEKDIFILDKEKRHFNLINFSAGIYFVKYFDEHQSIVIPIVIL